MSESMTLDEVKSSLTETVRDRSNEKARQREQIRRDVEAFLAAGGEIKQVAFGMAGDKESEAVKINQNIVNADEAEAMLGTARGAIVSAVNRGSLYGVSFPDPMPRKAEDGQRVWNARHIVDFRKRLKAHSRAKAKKSA